MGLINQRKYFLRVLNVLVSCAAACFTFNFMYKWYESYLPVPYMLDQLNNPANGNLSAVLRDNSIGFREQYFHAFEKSIYFSLTAFVVTFLLVEYVYRSRHKQKEDSLKVIYEALGAFKERGKPKENNSTQEVNIRESLGR